MRSLVFWFGASEYTKVCARRIPRVYMLADILAGFWVPRHSLTCLGELQVRNSIRYTGIGKQLRNGNLLDIALQQFVSFALHFKVQNPRMRFSCLDFHFAQ
jgi:hypothetical protein